MAATFIIILLLLFHKTHLFRIEVTRGIQFQIRSYHFSKQFHV